MSRILPVIGCSHGFFLRLHDTLMRQSFKDSIAIQLLKNLIYPPPSVALNVDEYTHNVLYMHRRRLLHAAHLPICLVMSIGGMECHTFF